MSLSEKDYINLIKSGVEGKSGVWADFGSGEGTFTLALTHIAGPEVYIYSVDKNKNSLQVQKRTFKNKFPNTKIEFLHKDFTEELNLPKLDGIIMANSLHFVKNKKRVLNKSKRYLKKTGIFILVEYNTDKGNTWVPYPLSFKKFKELAESVGFKNVKMLKGASSGFLNGMYSASAKLFNDF